MVDVQCERSASIAKPLRFWDNLLLWYNLVYPVNAAGKALTLVLSTGSANVVYFLYNNKLPLIASISDLMMPMMLFCAWTNWTWHSFQHMERTDDCGPIKHHYL